MALPSSGVLTLDDIQTEFGGTNPIDLSDYYRGGGLVPDSAGNSSIPTSGAISVSDFYGSANSVSLDFTLRGAVVSRGPGTYTGVSIGTANANRMVVISANSIAGVIPSGITINGTAMTRINLTRGGYIAFKKVPTGTTATIVISGGDTFTTQIYTLNTVNSSTSNSQINYATSSVGAATSGSFTLSTTVSDDGVLIWGGFIQGLPPGGSFSSSITTNNSSGVTTRNYVAGTSGSTRQGYSVCTTNDTRFARYTWGRTATKPGNYGRGAVFAFFKAN